MPLDMDLSKLRHGTELLKRGFAKMQKGGVIMDVINAEQASKGSRPTYAPPAAWRGWPTPRRYRR
jgi:hypothetical protein